MDENLKDAYLEIEIAGLPRHFPLSPDEICRIGRSGDNTVVLENDSVSRKHASLQGLQEGTFLLFDLGSRNGTFLNGQRLLTATILQNGDRITIGKIEITFHQAGREGSRASDQATAESTILSFARKLITVLVFDIRDSTALARQLEFDRFLQIAGALFRGAGKVLQERGAWTQKYMGDGVMAVWLHKEDGSEIGREARNVINGLIEVVDVVAGLQHRFGLDAPIRVGSGLNSGWASIGNVGSAAAADYTAMGDVVNKAFRLESATKEAGYDLLVSTETLSFLLKSGRSRNLFRECPVKLKGYDQPVVAWGANFAELAGFEEPADLSIAPPIPPAS